MESLAKLFDGMNRVKIMRLFLFNPDNSYDKPDIIKKSRVSSDLAYKIVKQMEEADMIERKTFLKERKKILKGKEKIEKKKANGWCLNKNFSHLIPLQNLLLNKELLEDGQIVEKLKKTGKIKLIVLSGIFTNRMEESRADILVVGDKINKKSLENVMQDLESQVGKELMYAVFSTEEFYYRLDICDKLIRDILDYPHKRILGKL